jgi:uracil DNA glycosylase
MNLQEQLGPEWYDLLGPLFAEDWMETLGKRIGAVDELYGEGALQPRLDDVFKAYRYVQPSQLKVLILGQD